ncbi:MAG: HI0074 family nucleotidyltransferase substrate-binding subunit [Eubacterium sp.]|nr:HI0074 family nucleotidyltransferase substrate-binding subunit [Eubacterium sp.]
MKKFDHYQSNLKVLQRADQEDLSNDFIIGGIIDKFFIQFELAWKVLKELLKYEGRVVSASGSPRVILKEAFSIYDFIDEEIWLSMLRARNDMTHVYDAAAARRMVDTILEDYIPAFLKLQNGISAFYGDALKNM